MSKSKSSSSNPRKFAEKIALLNKSEAETTAEFEKILKEVEETTRVPPQPHQFWYPPARSASFSNRLASESGRPPQRQQQQPQRHQQQQQQQRTGGPPLQQQHQYQANHVYGYHDSNRFFSQAQFAPLAGNQMGRADQQVVDTVQQQHHHQQQQQHLLQFQPIHQQQNPQQQQQRSPVHVDQLHSQPNSYMQQQQPLTLSNPINIQAKIEVPNIEIFSIDDEYQQQQQRQQLRPHMQITPPIPASDTNDSLTNGHYRDHCSNTTSPISPARSLPNIASLSMSSPQTFSIQHVAGANQLAPPINTGHLSASPSANSLLSLTNAANQTDDGFHHHLLDSAGDWYNGEEQPHSLPPIHDQSSNCASLQDQHQQSPTQQQQQQQQLARVDSWQQLAAVNSAPSSAAPTPPYIQASPYSDQQQQHSPQQQAVHSAESSPHRQQHSPQSLQQDQYYSLQPIQVHSPLVRANSTTNIGKYPIGDDLLETPLINNNLSKSSDACYNYQDEFIPSEIFSNQLASSGGGRRDLNYVDNSSDLHYVSMTTTNLVTGTYIEKNNESNLQNHW